MTTKSSRMLQQKDKLMRMTRANLLPAYLIHNTNIAEENTEFAINSYGLALPCTQPKSRLQAHWSEPYRVVEHNACKCKLQIKKKCSMLHK